MRKHVAGPACPGCEDRKVLAHSDLQEWFTRRKAAHPDLHISWSFRDKAGQTQCLADGTTRLPWPKSKHNASPSNALDVFQLCSNGMAAWPWGYFMQLAAETKAECAPIRWGGDFPKVPGQEEDGDHFERMES